MNEKQEGEERNNSCVYAYKRAHLSASISPAGRDQKIAKSVNAGKTREEAQFPNTLSTSVRSCEMLTLDEKGTQVAVRVWNVPSLGLLSGASDSVGVEQS